MGALALGAGAAPAGGAADLDALVNSLPDCDKDGKYTGPDPETAQKAVDIILKGGKPLVVALVDMLKEPDKGDDYKANYLLHAVATYARRPDAEDQRKSVTEALVSTLEGERPVIVRKHVLEELLWIGGTEPVEALTKLLLDPELCDFAARALEARKMAAPLRAAQPKAAGRNRVALIQALGELHDAEAVPALVQDAASADPDVRLAAVEALANIGDPRGVDAVLAAAKMEKATYGEMGAAEAALRLGQNLLDAGKKDEARRIYVTLSKQWPGKPGRHVRAGCLRGLAAAAGDEILTELLAALTDADPQVRAVAADVAATLPGGGAVEKWLGLLAQAKPADRPGILFVLGSIGDAKALPVVLQAMDDQDGVARREAMRAAAAIGGEQAAQALVARALGKQGEERETAIDCLAKSRGTEANKVVGDAIKQATDPAVKAQLLDVLAARRASDQMAVLVASAADGDAAVRTAAARALGVVGGDREAAVLVKMLKSAQETNERTAAESALLDIGLRARDQVADVIVAGLEGASGQAAGAMLRVLGRVGGPKAAKALVACADSADPKVKDDAIRALSGWSDDRGIVEVADGLLKIASGADDPKQQAMALRGYINLAQSRPWRREPARQLKIYGEALKIAKRAEEKRAVLGALGDLQEVQALSLAASCLQDKEVGEEAAATVVRIANHLKNKTDEPVQAALQGVVEVAKNENTVKEAKRLLIKKP